MNRSFLPVRLQSARLLFAADTVEEILGAVPWLPLPRSRAAIPGIVTWRTRAVPVVDMAAFVPGLSLLRPDERRARTIIVRAGGSFLALLVDAASEIEPLAPEALRPKHAGTCDVAEAEAEVRGELMMVVSQQAMHDRLFAREAGVAAG